MMDDETRSTLTGIETQLERIAAALIRPTLVEIDTPESPVVIALDSIRWIDYNYVYLTNDQDTIPISSSDRDRLLAYLRQTGRLIDLREAVQE